MNEAIQTELAILVPLRKPKSRVRPTPLDEANLRQIQAISGLSFPEIIRRCLRLAYGEAERQGTCEFLLPLTHGFRPNRRRPGQPRKAVRQVRLEREIARHLRELEAKQAALAELRRHNSTDGDVANPTKTRSAA